MFEKEFNEVEKEYGVGGGNFFKFSEGKNKIRILAGVKPLATHFMGKGKKGAVCYGKDKGCPFHGENAPKDKDGKEVKARVQFVSYIIDRLHGDKLTLAYLPYSVIKALDVLAADENWTFSELPMPYDITVNFDSKAAPADMYKVFPVPDKTPVSQEVMEELVSKPTVEEIIKKQKNKSKVVPTNEEEEESEDNDIKSEDLPF